MSHEPSDAPAPVVTEEQAWEKWQEIGGLIDALERRMDTRDEWVAQPGSSLAGDDRASSPYQVTHALTQCLMAGIDHAHAVKSLVVDQKVLHTAAPASLARGFIENMATAFWILHPSQRRERIARAMKWHVRNIHDQTEALRDASSVPAPIRTPGERITQAVELGLAAGVEDPEYIRRGYRPSQPLEYVDAESGLGGMGVLFAWRLCSAFAHGRPWAYLGVLEQQRLPTSAPGVLDVRMTNDLARSLYPILTAMHLTEVVVKLHGERARPLFS